jgi:pilus assembly protein CpaF
VAVHLRRAAGGRVLDAICLLLPGPDRMVTAVPAWRRGSGPGPAATELARILTRRAVPVPDLLAAVADPGRAP